MLSQCGPSLKSNIRACRFMITMRYAHPEDSLREAVEGIANFTQDRSQVKMEE
jgi:hypothetical protein